MPINIDNSRSKQDQGVWTAFGGSQFKIVNTGSVRFQRVLNRLQAPYKKRIDKGTLDPAVSREILCEAMAEAMVVDWKDVVDGQNQPVEFSQEACKQALLNNDDLREYVSDFSMDLENFRAEEKAEQGKS